MLRSTFAPTSCFGGRSRCISLHSVIHYSIRSTMSFGTVRFLLIYIYVYKIVLVSCAFLWLFSEKDLNSCAYQLRT
jgi:hypothetical protein